MNWNELSQTIVGFENVDLSGGVTADAIEAASNSIGLPFPPEFIEFLSKAGAGGVESEEFIGLGGPAHLDVVNRTNRLRAKSSPGEFPKHLIPIRADGFGNYDCIDTSTPTRDGEFAVVQWLHDGGKEQEMQRLAEGYFEWVAGILKMIREED